MMNRACLRQAYSDTFVLVSLLFLRPRARVRQDEHTFDTQTWPAPIRLQQAL